ncbi:hypothetical protein M413DRAFT_15962 [Hebeloma cylindrosporum]|uniref:Uncharacterized protein n=1 Tax=Hebeloma cylindrosporum TaxID=76867 RepID=A0A0C2YDJ6_HEBCY|nr:hypothetical protein M413DRAFT_15962 [Hebeloma cylindrosporum h7]
MAEIDRLPVSAEGSPVVPIADDMLDGEHEDQGQPENTLSAVRGEQTLHGDSNGTEGLNVSAERTQLIEESAAKAGDSKEPIAAKNKGAMSVNPPVKKANGGPPTPTVKKIINSGTFGTGSVKPAGTKPVSQAPATAASKATAPPLRKPTTSTPAASSKPLMTSSVSSKPPIVGAGSSRRASVAPVKTPAPPNVRQSLSASTNAKPAPDMAPVRNTVVSPTGSVGSAKAATPAARPRASVSEAVKKAPLSSRSSVTGSVKATAPTKVTPLSRSSASAPAKATRPASSISSIKEIKEDAKEDGNAFLELQSQLNEVTKSLDAKGLVVADLEAQIENLEASLTTALSEVELKSADLKKLMESKATVDLTLEEAQMSLSKVQAEFDELEDANSGAAVQSSVVQALHTQIQELEVALSSSKETVEVLEETGAAAASSAAEAASVEREALLKAQADFKAISEEVEALKVSHTMALEDSLGQIAELRERSSVTATLEAQIASLKAEKEESANKLSELEIEILELKESQEGLEDTRDTLQRRIATLEDDLAMAAVTSGLAAEAATKKEMEHAQAVEALIGQHKKELEADSVRFDELKATLEALQKEHSEALVLYERCKQNLVDNEGRHASELMALEDAQVAQQAAHAAELEKVMKELQNQENIYNSKVDIVKAEHSRLLDEAFERAKNEAAQAHSQELQTLRSTSNATIEQIQSANIIALENIKADHASALEDEVNGLQKQITKLNIELKATQDDLAKAKAALETSHNEVETLTKQRDEARAQAQAAPSLSSEYAEELSRVTTELSISKNDLQAVTDMLTFTESSMAELSDNHKKELEEAARIRADEILKLRSEHDREVTTFATQKSELLVKLSDLEGELATVKADIAAQGSSSSRSNGNVISQPATSPAVTKEELAKLHEAHNLKIYDLQAEHDKSAKHARDELEAAYNKISELQQDITRKAMEIQYLEQDQEESQEQITRLKEDLNSLTEKLANS